MDNFTNEKFYPFSILILVIRYLLGKYWSSLSLCESLEGKGCVVPMSMPTAPGTVPGTQHSLNPFKSNK